MKNPFRPGDRMHYRVVVTPDSMARFEDRMVHPVYGTFALGRDAEWAGRLFVLEMLEEGEEGIGTHLSVEHVSPAPVGSEVMISARLEEVQGNAVRCSFTATVGDRLIARGETGQKIIQKARFDAYLATLQEKEA
jgi:fluoroacetyl-CoA thioesterase